MNGPLAFLRRAFALGLILLLPPVLFAYLGEQGIPGFTWLSLPRIAWPLSLWIGAAIGVGVALLWPWIAPRATDERLHAWADLIVRRTLTLVFLSYGLSKLLRFQFYEPYYYWQETQAGDLTGFELTWYFFGASYAYSIFVGLGEIAAAMLLVFRRTRVAGALLLALVGANILAVNIAYDVGVAHFAGLMLAGCVYILAAELPRITAFFFGAGVTPAPERADPYFLSGSGRAVSNFTAIFVLLLPVADKVRDMPRGAVVSMPLTGAWEIVSASLSPPNPTNAAIRQWSRISFEKNFGGNQVAVWVADSMAHGRFQADTVAQQLRMTVAGYAVEPAFSGQWRLQADSIAHLRGTSGTDSVYLVLRRIR